ncbi:GGDEF domain-containing protein [Ensifer soli]|uniref:GGDEF domain-containing protein n=1 Tax=Ciceribacter sp. sgz301302 TaxID=3342379 RepID=UPI0035B93CFD
MASVGKIAECACLAFVLIVGASLSGIASRPLGELASIWPANALVLAMLVRQPDRSRRAAILLAACAGSLAADMATGSALSKAVLLNIGNLVTVVGGYLVLRRFPPEVRGLRQPISVPLVCAACLAAAAVSAATGAVLNPLLFSGTVLDGVRYWFISELVNLLAFLPAFLTVPSGAWQRRQAMPHLTRAAVHHAAPAVSVVLACGLALLVGGPGAIVFALPFLLWSAVVYGIFEVALLSLLYVAWALLSISFDWLAIGSFSTGDPHAVLSLRLGLSFIVLGPLTVASVMSARTALLHRTRHLADHDMLTAVLNRRAFTLCATEVLVACQAEHRPCALLMLDIDRFKSINDRHGHAAGDRVLTAFAGHLRQSVREGDLVGRLGGEEFAVLLHPGDEAEAVEIADRIRIGFAAMPVPLDAGASVAATVSIGVATSARDGYRLDRMLSAADQRLYHAKDSGRDRVVRDLPAAGAVMPA